MLLSFFTPNLHILLPLHLRFLSKMASHATFSDILDKDVYKYYADGQWKTSSSSKTVPIINPTTRNTQYKVQGNLHA